MISGSLADGGWEGMASWLTFSTGVLKLVKGAKIPQSLMQNHYTTDLSGYWVSRRPAKKEDALNFLRVHASKYNFTSGHVFVPLQYYVIQAKYLY